MIHFQRIYSTCVHCVTPNLIYCQMQLYSLLSIGSTINCWLINRYAKSVVNVCSPLEQSLSAQGALLWRNSVMCQGTCGIWTGPNSFFPLSNHKDKNAVLHARLFHPKHWTFRSLFLFVGSQALTTVALRSYSSKQWPSIYLTLMVIKQIP